MRRYYICPVVGDGTEENPYRPKVANYGVSWIGVMATNPDGTPKRPWTLVLVNAVDHTSLLADNQIFDIPDVTLDSTFGSLNNPTRRRVTDELTALGIDTSWINVNTPVREIIRAVGQASEPRFDENKFDVAA